MVISEEFKRKVRNLEAFDFVLFSFHQVFQIDELKQILGDIQVSIALAPEQWGKILEQILLVVLILGRHVKYVQIKFNFSCRWLLPKGKMSRDQFSQLMLVYTGMAADIVEIFEAFRESKVSD